MNFQSGRLPLADTERVSHSRKRLCVRNGQRRCAIEPPGPACVNHEKLPCFNPKERDIPWQMTRPRHRGQSGKLGALETFSTENDLHTGVAN